MRFFLSLTFGLLASSPSVADAFCAEAWFVRNLAFDRAGYCFGSPLGQALFDNDDCSTKSPKLSAEDQKIVTAIRETEDMVGCKIDTTARFMAVPHETLWRGMVDLAAPADWASGCLGWQGADFPLYAAHAPGARVTAVARAGMVIEWEYDTFAPTGWEFITLYTRDFEFLGMGWSNTRIDTALCEQMAG